MYVEAEAKMDTYQAQDGSNRTQLNLLQREFLHQHTHVLVEINGGTDS